MKNEQVQPIEPVESTQNKKASSGDLIVDPSDDSMEVEVKKEPSFLPCACPCKCGRITTILDNGALALARHARCAECSVKGHIAENRDVEIVNANRSSRPITEIYRLTDEEKTIALEANKDNQRELWRAAWAVWKNSLPEKFQKAHTDHPQVLKAIELIKNGQKATASLPILGSVGAGKSWVAISYANQVILAGLLKPSEVLFGSEAELLASAANSKFGEVETELQRIVSRRYKMLIIDDVGRGTWLREDMRAKVFFLVLDKYWADNKIVVITSNLNQADLTAYIGEGAMDRLRSMAGYKAIILDEKMRRKITEEMMKAGVTPMEVHATSNIATPATSNSAAVALAKPTQPVNSKPVSNVKPSATSSTVKPATPPSSPQPNPPSKR
jgi:DNA replication protein DnaC